MRAHTQNTIFPLFQVSLQTGDFLLTEVLTHSLYELSKSQFHAATTTIIHLSYAFLNTESYSLVYTNCDHSILKLIILAQLSIA